MKIATWNVNSLKVRLPQVLNWIQTENPDILAVQEIKMETGAVSEKIFAEQNYYTAINGQKTYNGVALFSKKKLTDIDMPDFDHQRRIIAATVDNIRIINLYVPNGESVISPKYEYKLNWLKYVTHYLAQALKIYAEIIILGDFNIIPADQDTHDPVLWTGKVLFTEPEVNAFKQMLALGFYDSFRLFEQPSASYTWWDYRMMGFRRNRGLRIDHILVSRSLKNNCQACYIDKKQRSLERPSDHAPVVLTLAFS